MPINQRELLQAVSQISELQSMRVTIRQSGKWGLITGAAVFGGGLLLGPTGLALGGIIGGCAGALKSRGQFKSVAEVLMNDLTNTAARIVNNTSSKSCPRCGHPRRCCPFTFHYEQ
ncbi:protein C19orf12 homolog [Ctenocephalides felis]|uniref:protein C19orf12 homolog n=1 Tax=Ctenocephalides felis TaxID=7515 RepID=UPI000E6E20C7|nr:protein C19orf12 homolog [Ctenocephalides felis]